MSRWREINDVNRSTIGRVPDRILPGQVLHERPDGRLAERGHGRLRFVRGAESTVLDFDEGTAFEHWGYRMAVFGGGDFELSVFPAGEPVGP